MSQNAITEAIVALTNVTGVLTPKGDVADENELPNTATDGDMYFILDIRVWAFYLMGEWYKLNASVDLSDYFTKSQTDAAIIAITGDKANLTTTDKSNLVNAINENKTQITSISNNTSNLETNINNIDGRLTTTEGKLTTAEGKITTLESDLTTLTGRVTTAETNIGNNTTAIGNKANSSDLNTTNTNLNNLTGRVTTAEGDIITNANAISTETTNRQTAISNIKQFNTYIAANDAAALTYSQSNPTVLVMVKE